MDAPLLMVWVVRLLFLALLYVFLARVVRSLLTRPAGRGAPAGRVPRPADRRRIAER